MPDKKPIHSDDVLIVVDMQQDFLPGGSLAVPAGDEIIPLINEVAARFVNVILTQDWHPPLHISFATTHGLQPFVDTVQASYGPQSLWPDHCLQRSPGSAFPAALDVPHASLVLRKGFRRNVDSYSAFLENDHVTGTGLAGYLRERSVRRVYICGLAWDYCVGNTALDGAALGFDVRVLTDATRGISPASMKGMTERWQRAGVLQQQSPALLSWPG